VGGNNAATVDQVARIVRLSLEGGKSIEIDRLGTFRAQADGRFEFIPNKSTTVFIAYVEEDLAWADKLYEHLEEVGLAPWMDRRDLLPGQNWPRAIERVIEVSDFFVALLSRKSLVKRSVFQSELRWALDCARRQPLDSIFFIPVRLDDCEVPWRISRILQHIDLASDPERGLRRIAAMIKREVARRKRL
jgi:hypothetical protein